MTGRLPLGWPSVFSSVKWGSPMTSSSAAGRLERKRGKAPEKGLGGGHQAAASDAGRPAGLTPSSPRPHPTTFSRASVSGLLMFFCDFTVEYLFKNNDSVQGNCLPFVLKAPGLAGFLGIF